MKALRISTMVLALGALTMPAHAAVIGLLGGDFDPIPPISDGSTNGFQNCNNETPPTLGNDNSFDNFQCIFFTFPDLDNNESADTITSIDFLLFGAEGLEFSVDNGDAHDDTDFSFLQVLTFNEDGSLRLNGGSIVPPNPPICEFGECPFLPGLALFIAPSFFGEDLSGITAQVVAVNDIATVPEPATLLLLGPGALAAVLARRRRGRTTNV